MDEQELSIDYNDPMMYGGSDPNRIEFPVSLPSTDPDDNIPAVQGAPVEVTGDPMYTEGYSQNTGAFFDPITKDSYPSIEAFKAATPTFTSGTRDSRGNTYNQRLKIAGANPLDKSKKGRARMAAATSAMPVVARGLEAKGAEGNPSIELTRKADHPMAPGQGMGTITERMGLEFLAKHGSTEQQQLASERLLKKGNLAPRMPLR